MRLLFSPLPITRIYGLGFDLFIRVVGDYDCDVFVIVTKYPSLHPLIPDIILSLGTLFVFFHLSGIVECYRVWVLENVMKKWR